MMEDELKKIWQDSSRTDFITYNKFKIMMELDTKLKKFDRGIFWRNIREIVACLLVIPMFFWMAYQKEHIMATIGAILSVPVTLLIVYMLLHVKKYKPKDLTLPLKQYLSQQRLYLQKEKYLLRNVLYWYALPVACCAALVSADSWTNLLIMLLLLTIVVWFVNKINQKAVDKHIQPLLDEVELSLSELEKNS